jgi:integrase
VDALREHRTRQDVLKRQAGRELRHSFVSLMSDAGVPLEHISRLVGHSGTTTTETIYRKQIRPVLIEGTDAMDRIFPAPDSQS